MAWSTSRSEGRELQRTNKRGRAFIVESLVLFVFLVATLIIVSMLFFASVSMSAEAQNLERATIIASNTAERFSADPTRSDLDSSEYGLDVSCAVNTQTVGDGTLYLAHIMVLNGDELIYSVDTSRFVGGVS